MNHGVCDSLEMYESSAMRCDGSQERTTMLVCREIELAIHAVEWYNKLPYDFAHFSHLQLSYKKILSKQIIGDYLQSSSQVPSEKFYRLFYSKPRLVVLESKQTGLLLVDYNS